MVCACSLLSWQSPTTASGSWHTPPSSQPCTQPLTGPHRCWENAPWCPTPPRGQRYSHYWFPSMRLVSNTPSQECSQVENVLQSQGNNARAAAVLHHGEGLTWRCLSLVQRDCTWSYFCYLKPAVNWRDSGHRNNSATWPICVAKCAERYTQMLFHHKIKSHKKKHTAKCSSF